MKYRLSIPCERETYEDYYEDFVEAPTIEEAVKEFRKRMPFNEADDWSEDFLLQYVEEVKECNIDNQNM